MSSTTEDLMNAAVPVKSVEAIEALPLGTVSVHVAGLDDAQARALTRLGRLQCVLGDGSPIISDDGLGLLTQLSNLRVLDLEWCATITDVGLLKLGNLKQLQWLDLSSCRGVSVDGINKIRSLLPDCKIELAST